MRTTWMLLTLALASSACLRQTEYRCATSADCGAGGTCEAIGFCSFVDGSCAGGGRFGEAAGAYANQCVGDVPVGDAGVDGPPLVDAPPGDAPPTGCPAGYDTIPGGQGTHRYRLITTAANWGNQRAFCAATSGAAYLAIPDDLTELQAISALAPGTRYWVGLSDSATEGTFVTVKNEPATFLPWEPPAPDNGGPGEDCVEAIAGSSTFNDQRCNTQYRAVCECEP